MEAKIHTITGHSFTMSMGTGKAGESELIEEVKKYGAWDGSTFYPYHSITHIKFN